MVSNRRGVIWDMDGVLIDSGDLHYQTWRDALADEADFHLTRTQFDATFGRDNTETLTVLLGRPPTPEELVRIAGRKERHYRELAPAHIRPLPGAMELVEALAGAGWRQAVGTSAPRENLELIVSLLGIGGWLAAQVCVDDVPRGKPDPALFVMAAERMGVPPGRCVVVEDSPAGVAAARAGGMACLALTTTHPASELLDADRVAEGLAGMTVGELEAMLETQGTP